MSSIKKFINLELNSFYTKIQLVCKSYYQNVDVRGLNFTVSKTQLFINFVGNIMELWRKRPNPQKIYACGGDKLGPGGRCLYLSYIFTCSIFQLSSLNPRLVGLTFFFFWVGALLTNFLFFYFFKLWKTFVVNYDLLDRSYTMTQ